MPSLEFLVTALIIVLIPGSGVILTVSSALVAGRRACLWTATGCTLGIVPHLLASVLGLSALLHTSALAFQGLMFSRQALSTSWPAAVGVAWVSTAKAAWSRQVA